MTFVVHSSPLLEAVGFKALITRISKRYPSDSKPMPTVSPDEPFQFPAQVLRPAEPPNRIPRPEPRPLTLEQQMLRQNHGNPVLRAQ